jgi:plasmid stabilization system protein ParE
MGRQKKATAKVYQINVSENALRNIDEITGYIAFIKHQPVNAIKVGDAIFNTIDRIGLNPFAFKECEELPTKSKIYRKAICKSWSIIFKITKVEVLILGVIHNSRKPAKIKVLKKVK